MSLLQAALVESVRQKCVVTGRISGATNLYRKKGALRVLRVFVEEPSDELQIGGRAVRPVKFPCGSVST